MGCPDSRAECAAGAHAVADDLPGVYAPLHARGIVWVVGGWFARAREAGFALPKRHFFRFVGREGTSKFDVSKIDLDGPPEPDS